MAYNKIDDISKILNDYANTIQTDLAQIVEDVAKEGMNKLKNEKSTYQVRTGDYNKSWRIQKKSGDRWVGRIIYSDKHYRLTHLLENGHIIKNQYGTYGLTKPFKHIAPVEEYCRKEYTSRLEETIKRGG